LSLLCTPTVSTVGGFFWTLFRNLVYYNVDFVYCVNPDSIPMLPTTTSSNNFDQGCVPTSSNCIVWQGPNIPCINLCTGDSVTDVVYKMAEKLCQVQSAYDLTNLQLNDLATFCTAIAGPPTGLNKNLLNVLDYIVKKLDCVNDKVDAIPIVTPVTPDGPITLPTCLQYTAGGQTVTQLSHYNFSILIGSRVCTLEGNVTTIQNQIANIIVSVNNLSGNPTSLPTVVPECSYPNIPQSQPVAMNLLLDAVEADLCSFRKIVGNNTQIGAATGQPSTSICSSILNVNGLNGAQPLSKPSGTTMAGAYGASGWNSVVTNLSQSIQNLWITVLDMRCVINDLRSCCGAVDCSKFILDFTTGVDVTRQNVTLNFVNKMSFPGTGFVNGTGANKPKVIIINRVGVNPNENFNLTTENYIIQDLDLVSLLTSGPVQIPVFGSGVTNPLDPTKPYAIIVRGSIVKDGIDCNKETIKYSYVSCPVVQITGSSVNIP